MYTSGVGCWEWGGCGYVVLGNIPSTQFCCEPKTALKNSVLKKKWQAYTFSKHEKEPLFLSSNGGISWMKMKEQDRWEI